MLTEEFKEFIKIKSQKSYPDECCGLILNDGRIVSCRNISKTPERSFLIDNENIYKYGLDNTIGFYHSHKDYPEFSVTDVAFSEKLKKTCILYVVDLDLFKEYEPNGAEIPYEGRPFIINGNMFCLPLIKDYYRRELNIILSDFNTPQQLPPETHKDIDTSIGSYSEISEVIIDYFIGNGFVQVKKPKIHDIIQIKLPYTPTPEVIIWKGNKRFLKESFSLLIYLKDNQVLHSINEFSCIDNYRNAFHRLTTHIFRHKSLL